MERKSTETVAPEPIGQSPIRILSPGCEVGERYEVRNVLGMGGSGVVYAVFDRELRRNVALKVLRSDRMSESALKRFRREVAVARDAESPHLVRVYDLAQSAESIYLTMELVEGESLAKRLERGPMPVAEAIEIGAQILIALEALHTIGIVHRDIKPSNVMVTPGGVVKLTDFGLARRVDSETRATESESVVGTYEYLSPEQALGEEIDARADLYSFGILMFECLTGDVPLRGGSSLGTVIAHVSKPTPDVRSRRADVPRWLGAMIERLLRKTRDERYQTAGAVLQDLRARRGPRRVHAWSIAVAVLGVVLLLAAGVAALRTFDRSQFAGLIVDEPEGVRALNRRGETLWSHPWLRPGLRSVVATMPGGVTRVLAIKANPLRHDEENAHQLLVLDTATGATLDRVQLPTMKSVFPQYSGWFSLCGMTAVDTDHNNIHEIVISYCHTPYWPSYSVVYDPERSRVVPVLIASGHHRLLGTLDVDRDGRDELIFWGPSNRLGWYTAVAAVRAALDAGARGEVATASTPDAAYSPTSRRALLWYALVGSGGFNVRAKPVLDPRSGTIEIEEENGTKVVLDRTGFVAGSSATRAIELERSAARERSYEALRHAIRLVETGFAADSLRRADDAVADADRARDVPLGVWTRRVRVRLNIHAGRGATVEPLLRDVMSRFATPADACWDAASAFHLRGDLPSALHWYREGLRELTEAKQGRMTWEFLDGVIFTLAEMNRWDEARAAIEMFDRAFPKTLGGGGGDYYRAWITWRMTGTFASALEGKGDGTLVDFCEYVALESQAAVAEADVRQLLTRVVAARKQLSGIHKAALVSLEAELLERSGDHTAAIETATRAMADANALLGVEPAARLHAKVIAARLKRIRGTSHTDQR